MNDIQANIIDGISVVQNKQDFVIGKFTISQVLSFTKYTRRILNDFDEEGIPIYNDQVQRDVENARVQKIADFLIYDPQANFPTNLVLHIPTEVIESQVDNEDRIKIILKEKVFLEIDQHVYVTIIDGQHRIRGIEVAIERLLENIKSLSQTIRGGTSEELELELASYSDRLRDLRNIELVVSFFIDKTIEYQAMIFSTINRTQKRVSQSLVYSLFGLDTGDTPQKTALQVVLVLNGNQKSPFHNRIKLYGGSYDKRNSPPLSQATLVRSIVSNISESLRESENDRYKDRNKLLKRSIGSSKPLPFRNFYAKDEDHKISDIFFYFFNAVKKSYRNEDDRSFWDFSPREKTIDNILQTTVGYNVLLKILLRILGNGEGVEFDNSSIFENKLKKASILKFGDIDRYSFNNRGAKFLFLDMSLLIWPPDYVNNPNDKREEELRKLLGE